MASQQQTPGTSKSKTSAPPGRAAEEERSIQNYVSSYFKKAVVILAVWAVGFYKFSPSWLLLALVVYVWKERQQAAKQHSIAIAQQIARDERGTILARVEDLPSWVYFPDVERAEWVNKIVDQLWPYVGEYVRKLLKDSVEPKIREGLPASLGSFKFSKIDLGDIPPRIGGVKVYTSQVRRNEIYLDLEINYASDCNLAVQVKGMNFGVRDFTLRGPLRVIFRPLITRTPLIGGLSVFFLNNPELDFNLTNLANALDLPGLNEMLHSIVEEQISALMVLPNRLPIQIADDIDIRKLRYPLPQGVLQVLVIEAHDLVHADTALFGKGKSDPYAVVAVGAQTCETAVIPNTINPKWNQTFEFVIDEREGQLLKVDVKDQDVGKTDDYLGSVTMDISVICKKGSVEEWLPLEEVAKGLIHLRATWLYLSTDPKQFVKAKESSKSVGGETHTALLVVHLDSAFDLPRGKKMLKEPSPFALLTVGQVTQESSVRAATTEPSWEQNFRFFVSNPNHQSLDLEVRDGKTKKEIGELRVHLKTLMAAEGMVLERKFPLKTGQTGSSVLMTLALRILTVEPTPEWMEVDTQSIREASDKEVHRTWERVNSTRTPSSIADKPNSAATEAAKPECTATESHDPDPTPSDQDGGRLSSASEESTRQSDDSEVRHRKSVSSASSPASRQEDGGEFGLGRLQLTLRYSSSRQQLVVVLHRVVNLKGGEGDSGGLADSYITMCLMPDKEKRKTNVVKKDLNPVFDARFDYTISNSDLRGKSLELSVKKERGLFSSSHKLMGMALVDLSSLDTSRTVTQWLDLAPQDNLRASALKYNE